VSGTILLAVLLVGLVVVSTNTPAWAAQLEARIDPNNKESPFKMSYLTTVFIDYPNGGGLSDNLKGKNWTVSGTADSSNLEVQDLINRLNDRIVSNGSQAKIKNIAVDYEFYLSAKDSTTSIDYRVILEGNLTDYVITRDSQRSLVDLGWRGLSVDDEVNIDGVEINILINLLRDQEPEVYGYFVGTDVEDLLNRPLIDADFILEQPMTNWHFLFDPTGINVDAGGYGLNQEIAGFVVSSWTMGESSIREGRQVERVSEVTIMADQPYTVRNFQYVDLGNLHIIGFGALDILDGVEIAGITPTPPQGYSTTSTGDFPIFIIYGMAGLAAVAGIAFFFVSNRSLKNEKQGQQGIDPSRLVGYQTSASSGGYQTNRGEAQLIDESDYQQTRNVYDNDNNNGDSSDSSPPPQRTAMTAQDEAACGCATSVDMGVECDCVMQDSCLCDANCPCSAGICKENAREMS